MSFQRTSKLNIPAMLLSTFHSNFSAVRFEEVKYFIKGMIKSFYCNIFDRGSKGVRGSLNYSIGQLYLYSSAQEIFFFA